MIKSTTSNIFRMIDTLGDPFTLKLSSYNTHTTCLGGFISFFVLLFSVLLIGRYFYDLVDTTSPSITETKSIQKEYHSFDLYKEKKVFFIGVGTDGKSNIAVPAENMSQYITAFITIAHSKRTENNIFQDYFKIPFKPCKEVDQTMYSEIFEYEDLRVFSQGFGLCLDLNSSFKENYNIFGATTSIDFKTASLQIYPCSLDNKNDCTPDWQMNKMRIFLGETSYYTDHSNKESPISTSSSLDTLYKI